MPHMNLRLTLPIVFALAFPNLVVSVQAQVVPGTGQQIVEVFDDFEDPTWNFNLNLPKSSANIDKVERQPSGFANNRLFLESLYRGTPDFVRRIDTPAGGIPGSKGSLAMQTLNSGIPGQLSHTFQQDDLIAGVQQKLGYTRLRGRVPRDQSPRRRLRGRGSRRSDGGGLLAGADGGVVSARGAGVQRRLGVGRTLIF